MEITEIVFNDITYTVFPARQRWYIGLDGKERLYVDRCVHFFGEMDLPLTKPFRVARDVANHAAECCGYIARWDDQERTITVYEDSRAYCVTYGSARGIKNIEDVSVREYVRALQNENDWYRGRIEAIRQNGQSVSGLTIEEYERQIQINEEKVKVLLEKGIR